MMMTVGIYWLCVLCVVVHFRNSNSMYLEIYRILFWMERVLIPHLCLRTPCTRQLNLKELRVYRVDHTNGNKGEELLSKREAMPYQPSSNATAIFLSETICGKAMLSTDTSNKIVQDACRIDACRTKSDGL